MVRQSPAARCGSVGAGAFEFGLSMGLSLQLVSLAVLQKWEGGLRGCCPCWWQLKDEGGGRQWCLALLRKRKGKGGGASDSHVPYAHYTPPNTKAGPAQDVQLGALILIIKMISSTFRAHVFLKYSMLARLDWALSRCPVQS